MENSNFVLSKIKPLEVPYWGSPLIKVEGDNIAFIGEQRGQRLGVLSFDLHQSDMALTTEFPIFINNITSYLIDRDIMTNTQYNCGDNIEIVPLPEAEKIYISPLGGKAVELSSTYPIKPYDKAFNPGIYEIKQKELLYLHLHYHYR